MGKTTRPPRASSLKREIESAAASAEIARLKEQLRASESAKAKLAATLDRHLHTAKARPIPPAKPSRRGKEDIVRVIIPDTHGAKVDKGALAACLGDVKALDPDEIILLGDHVDCGGFLAQHHTLGYVAESAYTYEADIAAANAFLDALQAAAPRARIDYIEGNHERRIETWALTQTLRNSKDAEYLRRAFAPEFLLRLRERGIPYYRQGEFYDELPIPGTIRKGKCYFFHGSSTAKQATTVTLNSFAGNVVFGHTHREQSSSARPVHAGQIKAWNPGCLCELQPLWQHTNPTSWTHGFAVQLAAKSGEFLHLNIPIISGRSLLGSLAGKFQ
ncbi:MAG: metallophosphoesterase [Proteobacteria bacterium]|nr:metallophosphoesterase [Pseudomonadota bacterium]